MSSRYFLRYKNTIIGIISENKGSLSYLPLASADLISKWKGYPLGIYPPDLSNGIIKPKRNYTPTEKDILFWISDRILPPERENASALLKSIGLKGYDAWEIAKKTNGVNLNDYYWFSDNIKDSFKVIHPRGREKERSIARAAMRVKLPYKDLMASRDKLPNVIDSLGMNLGKEMRKVDKTDRLRNLFKAKDITDETSAAAERMVSRAKIKLLDSFSSVGRK